MPPPDTDVYAHKLLRKLRMDPAVAAAPPMSVVSSLDQHTHGWKKACKFTATSVHPVLLSRTSLLPPTTLCSLLSMLPWLTYPMPPGTPLFDGNLAPALRSPSPLLLPCASISFKQLFSFIQSLTRTTRSLAGLGLMSQAEKSSQMPAKQYNRRKKHRSMEAALNKVLTQDIWCQKRQSGALSSNHATSCDDCIVHSFAILCMP